MTVKLPCVDFNTNLRLGRIEGMTLHAVNGRANINTTLQGMQPDASIPALTALRATPAVVELASSSTADDAAGSGALTVLIVGLDENNLEVSETVIMDGQTEVATTQEFKANNKMTVVTAGAGGKNAGTIWCGSGTFTAGVPAVKYANIAIGANIGQSGQYTVPANKQAIIHDVIIRNGAIVAVTGNIVTGGTALETQIDFLDISNGGFDYQGHHSIAAGDYLRVEALAASAVNFSVEIALILVDV